MSDVRKLAERLKTEETPHVEYRVSSTRMQAGLVIETLADAIDTLSESNADLLEALEVFARAAKNVDAGGGDAVLTTCESLEAALAAIAKAKGESNG